MASKRFYFVGGPKEEFVEEFFRRLEANGGPPEGWTIYPHKSGDGKALHIVEGASRDDILEHISIFGDIYEMSDIVEVAG